MKNDSEQCIEFLCEEAPEQLAMTDPNSTQGQFSNEGNSLRFVAKFKFCVVEGELPLHMAKSNKTIMALLEHGSSTEAKNSMGKTAVHVMCDKKNLTCLLRLLSCDADPNAVDNQGNTPMHCAVLTHKSINSKKTLFPIADSIFREF